MGVVGERSGESKWNEAAGAGTSNGTTCAMCTRGTRCIVMMFCLRVMLRAILNAVPTTSEPKFVKKNELSEGGGRMVSKRSMRRRQVWLVVRDVVLSWAFSCQKGIAFHGAVQTLISARRQEQSFSGRTQVCDMHDCHT
jgi:hypothetical protein